jgi:hypothetical protein
MFRIKEITRFLGRGAVRNYIINKFIPTINHFYFICSLSFSLLSFFELFSFSALVFSFFSYTLFSIIFPSLLHAFIPSHVLSFSLPLISYFFPSFSAFIYNIIVFRLCFNSFQSQNGWQLHALLPLHYIFRSYSVSRVHTKLFNSIQFNLISLNFISFLSIQYCSI